MIDSNNILIYKLKFERDFYLGLINLGIISVIENIHLIFMDESRKYNYHMENSPATREVIRQNPLRYPLSSALLAQMMHNEAGIKFLATGDLYDLLKEEEERKVTILSYAEFPWNHWGHINRDNQMLLIHILRHDPLTWDRYDLK